MRKQDRKQASKHERIQERELKTKRDRKHDNLIAPPRSRLATTLIGHLRDQYLLFHENLQMRRCNIISSDVGVGRCCFNKLVFSLY